MTQTFSPDHTGGPSVSESAFGHGADGAGFSDQTAEQDGTDTEVGADAEGAAGASGSSGQDVAVAAIMAVAGLVLMLPAIGLMPNFGQWMDSHGPFVVMLPFMLWMMLAGGLLSNGVMKIIGAARGK